MFWWSKIWHYLRHIYVSWDDFESGNSGSIPCEPKSNMVKTEPYAQGVLGKTPNNYSN